MKSLRRQGLALSAGLVALGVAAGTAQASTSPVVKAIDGQETALRSSSAVQELKHVHITTPAQARRYVSKFGVIAIDLDRAATAVSHASATTSSQRTGRNEWVTSVRGLATGYRQVEDALKDLEHHDRTAAKTALLKGEKTIVSSAKLLIRADKVLGIKTPSTGSTT